jgi:hypothetical protein
MAIRKISELPKVDLLKESIRDNLKNSYMELSYSESEIEG